MEFQREEGLIRSDFALHAWRLLKQYDGLTVGLSRSERYEATLTVCVLQSLLTNCWELYKYLNSRGPRMLDKLSDFTSRLLTLPDVTVTSTFPEVPDAKAVIEHVRNALSHPRMRNTSPPTTGYTTVEDGSGLIGRMSFTDSPDLNSKGKLRAAAHERTGGDLQKVEVFTIELPVSRLTALAEEVAFLLAQPTMGNWDSGDLVPLNV